MSRSSNIRHMQLSYCSEMNNSLHWNFMCVLGSCIETICISLEKLLSMVKIQLPPH